MLATLKYYLTVWLYRLKGFIFKGDLHSLISTFVIYFGGIMVYEITIKFCPNLHNFHGFSRKDFISFWTSFTGLLLAFLVLLKVNNQKTNTGKDFIDMISGELSLLKKGQMMTIITPNLNIGSYLFRGESSYEIALRNALKRDVKVHFISLAIDINYLKKYPNEISEKLSFLKEGSKYNSPQLTYIYIRYLSSATNSKTKESLLSRFKSIFNNKKDDIINLCEITYNELTEILNHPNTKYTHCDSKFIDKKLVE